MDQANYYADQLQQARGYSQQMAPMPYPYQGMPSPEQIYWNARRSGYPQEYYQQPVMRPVTVDELGWMPAQMMRPFTPFIARRQPDFSRYSNMAYQPPWPSHAPDPMQQALVPETKADDYQHGSVIYPIDLSSQDDVDPSFVPHYSRQSRRKDLTLCDFCVRG